MRVSTRCVNGLLTHGIAESAMFAPATLCEYLGLALDFGERVDLGGATAAGMIWRAAAAVELGLCDAVVAVVPGSASQPQSQKRPPAAPNWYGASSNNYGSPQAEFEIPYGNVGQNAPYAQIGQRYAAEFGYDPAAVAKIAVDQRTNACAHPGAVFHGTPITVDDVLASPMIADPIHMLETVMRVHGGAGVLIANADIARRGRHRPVWIKGFGEHIAFKTPTYAEDLLRTPIARAADRAFAMAGLGRSEVDMASIYDCYTITVLMTLEDAGFCAQGPGDVVDRRPRPDLPRRLSAQHRGRPTVLRAGRHGRRHAPRRRRRPTGHGPRRRRAGARVRHRVRHRQRRHHERAGRAAGGPMARGTSP